MLSIITPQYYDSVSVILQFNEFLVIITHFPALFFLNEPLKCFASKKSVCYNRKEIIQYEYIFKQFKSNLLRRFTDEFREQEEQK